MIKNKTIQVEIMPDGLSAKEVNPLGDKEPAYIDGDQIGRSEHRRWQQAESQRKVYNIDMDFTIDVRLWHLSLGDFDNPKPGVIKFKPGKKYTAVITGEQTIKII